MVIADDNLASLFAALAAPEQAAVALHVMRGKVTEQSKAAIRRVRASLKRRVKLPRKLTRLA